MKTKTIGKYVYIVKKYYTNEEGDIINVMAETWNTKEDAFKDCQRYRKWYGEDNAFVFKAKQCIEIK